MFKEIVVIACLLGVCLGASIDSSEFEDLQQAESANPQFYGGGYGGGYNAGYGSQYGSQYGGGYGLSRGFGGLSLGGYGGLGNFGAYGGIGRGYGAYGSVYG